MNILKNTKIDFLARRKMAFLISGILILAGIVSLIINGGPKYSIDFDGGTSIVIRLHEEDFQVEKVRESLAEIGLADAEIQIFEQKSDKKITDILIRAEDIDDENAMYIDVPVDKSYNETRFMNLLRAYKTENPTIEYYKEYKLAILKGANLKDKSKEIALDIEAKEMGRALKNPASALIKAQVYKNFASLIVMEEAGSKDKGWVISEEHVGPKIGKEMQIDVLKAIFISLIAIIGYIWWRFEFRFGIAAVIALFHDVIITVGLFSITGREISLSVVAALLTLIGYSLNDTIVVFDRIRERTKLDRRLGFQEIINKSINQTLSRTILTSVLTFIAVAALFFFGGSVLENFSFAMMVGVIVGTYSSVFVAAPILVEWGLMKDKK